MNLKSLAGKSGHTLFREYYMFCIDGPENKGKMTDLHGDDQANPE